MYRDYSEASLIRHQIRVFKENYGYDPLEGPIAPEDETEDDLLWDEEDDEEEDRR